MTYYLNSFFPIRAILNFNCGYSSGYFCSRCRPVWMYHYTSSMFCVIVSGWVRRAGCGTICAAVVRADSSSRSAEESTAPRPRASSRLCVTWSVTQPGKEVTPISCFTLKSSLLLPKCSINCMYHNDLFTQSFRARLHQASTSTWDNSVLTLAILFSLKTMESLQIGVATHFQATPLFSTRTVWLVLLQSFHITDADAWCKRALNGTCTGTGTYIIWCGSFHSAAEAVPVLWQIFVPHSYLLSPSSRLATGFQSRYSWYSSVKTLAQYWFQ